MVRARRDHDHDEAETRESSIGSRRLALVAGIDLLDVVLELAGGLLFGSVALLGDAMYMLFDRLAYTMASGASYNAERFEGGQA